MKYFRGIYFWLMVVILTIIYFINVVYEKTLILLSLKPDDGNAIHLVACKWGIVTIKLMPIWKIEIKGKENLPEKGRAVVYVANHESMTDIWAMYNLNTQFRWLSKAEVKKIPVIGQVMTWAHYVFIERGNKGGHVRSLQACRNLLADGKSVFFFPEGTRSKTGEIKEFKMGAFKLAQNSKVDICPVVITGAKDLLPKGSLWPGKAKVLIEILPIMITPEDPSLIDEFCEQVRGSIIEVHSKMKLS